MNDEHTDASGTMSSSRLSQFESEVAKLKAWIDEGVDFGGGDFGAKESLGGEEQGREQNAGADRDESQRDDLVRIDAPLSHAVCPAATGADRTVRSGDASV